MGLNVDRLLEATCKASEKIYPMLPGVIFENARGRRPAANCFLSDLEEAETRSPVAWRILDNRTAGHFSSFPPMRRFNLYFEASIGLKTIGGVNARISPAELGCSLREDLFRDRVAATSYVNTGRRQ